MSTDVTAVLSGALLDALGRAGFPSVPASDVAWEVPRDPTHGDYATNVAMLLAKSHRRPPRQVAEAILAHLPGVDEIERAEVAGPGFLNVFLATAFLRAGLSDADALRLVEERSPDAFRFLPDAIEWRGHRVDRATIAATHAEGIGGFGSCSFTEPVGELRAMGGI